MNTILQWILGVVGSILLLLVVLNVFGIWHTFFDEDVWDIFDDDDNTPALISTTGDVPTTNSQPGGYTAPNNGTTPTMGCGPDKDVGSVQQLIGLSVVCLGTEYDAYTWRSVPIEVDATCPEGWVCTLHLAGDKIIVTDQAGLYAIVAGTFRRISGYPSGDAVYSPCDLLVKEQVFGTSQTPRFDVFAGPGLNCDGTSSISVNPAQAPQPAAPAQPAPQAPAPVAPEPQIQCPGSQAEVASAVGGDASSWSPLQDGWKYGGSDNPAPSASLSVPYGRLDYDGGSARAGQPVTVSEATFWCAG